MIYDNEVYLGSGLLISSNGFVVTCNHVIANASNIHIQVGSRKVLAHIYKHNPTNDLAILKIAGNFAIHFSPQKISGIQQGQRVYCFGFPLARDPKMRDVSLIDGIISTLNKDETCQLSSIQISAPINKGFSGGPVLEVDSGKVIGLVTTKLTKHPKYDDEIIENVAFCVPIDFVFSLISDFELTHEINWTNYANKLLDIYGQGVPFNNYIDLQCRNDKGEKHDLMSYVFDDWLSDKSRAFLSILGDFGSGKTLFCDKLAYELANAYINGKKDTKLPIIVKLRDHNEYENLHALLTDQVGTILELSELSWRQLEVMLYSGKILIIYDGFDEMSMKASRFQIIENFNEIKNTIVSGAKVILTCRTHYFGTEFEECYVLTRTKGPDFFEGLISEGSIPEQTSIIYLENLTDNDVQTFLKNKVGKEWKNLYKSINSPQLYDLNDLAKRPIFLHVIATTLPKFEFIGKKITGTDLYQNYTESCFEREAELRGLSPEQGSQFIEKVAFESYVAGHSYIIETVVDALSSKLKTQRKDIEQFLRKCPFLKRLTDTSGKFDFIHRSFFEYFVAKKIAQDIQMRKHATFAAEYLTPQIDKYLFELLEIANNIHIITSWLEKHPDVNVRMNCALTIGRSGQKKFIPLLETCLANEKDIGAAGRISDALDSMGVKDAVEKFLSNLERYSQLKQETGKSDNHKLLYDIVGPLEITNTDVIKNLIDNLSHSNARIRKYAAFILGRIRSHDSIHRLIELLKSSNETIRTRRYAAAALGLIGSIRAIPDLEEVSLRHKNVYLQQECLKAIERIKRNK